MFVINVFVVCVNKSCPLIQLDSNRLAITIIVSINPSLTMYVVVTTLIQFTDIPKTSFTFENLERELKTVMRWHRLGTNLRIPQEKLEEIELNYPSN